MLARDQVIKRVKDFKAKFGVQDEQDENVVATLHLMNTHEMDLHAAQDHTSRGSSDHGIDAWHFDTTSSCLTIYQSKLSNSKAMALKGFEGLLSACEWLAELLETSTLSAPPTNGGIYNLVQCIASSQSTIRNVRCLLISPFDENELDDEEEFARTRADMGRSALYKLLKARDGKLDIGAEQYNFARSGVVPPTSYALEVKETTTLTVDKKVRLDLVLVTLYSLIELFRRRGTLIFEKNVRLYLTTKEAKARLEHPMEETLEQICTSKVDPHSFPFYHVGMTISADASDLQDGKLMLDAPYIINGCQTVNIARRYLDKLEKAKSLDKIARFKLIPVVAKVVTRASSAQLREIANCNNRQNPIEPWQLFSNDPIHGEIEVALKDAGVFYERQKGRFDAEFVQLRGYQTYPNTNNTYVTVVGLGQIICLCRRQFQMAAKPSEIFTNKEKHDSVFTTDVAENPADIIWAFNAHKAVKRALQNYLSKPTQDNEQTHRIFDKPIVKQAMHFIAMMHLYQRKSDLSAMFTATLNKKAAQSLIDEAESCYRSVVKKMKDFYLSTSKTLSVEVSWTKLEAFLIRLCTDAGLDYEGPAPFTSKRIDWISEPAAETA